MDATFNAYLRTPWQILRGASASALGKFSNLKKRGELEIVRDARSAFVVVESEDRHVEKLRQRARQRQEPVTPAVGTTKHERAKAEAKARAADKLRMGVGFFFRARTSPFIGGVVAPHFTTPNLTIHHPPPKAALQGGEDVKLHPLR